MPLKFLIVPLVLLFVGCSDVVEITPPPLGDCTPNSVSICRCPDGAVGSRECDQDGLFTDCVCEGGSGGMGGSGGEAGTGGSGGEAGAGGSGGTGGDGGNPGDGEQLCSDGSDNDGDGLIDCDDPDCSVAGDCPAQAEDCSDRRDNNDDGLVDCADPLCANDESCVNRESDCSDEVDNDTDGDVDCDDADCQLDPNCHESDCDNELDDDNDGSTDCDDSDCEQSAACGGPAAEICDDGLDNDEDGQFDCEDSDCEESPLCPETECDDAVDNDRDGSVDCDDPDCTASEHCVTPEICDDDDDNDGDGAIDCEDPDCEAAAACLVEICHNDVDDDGDGDNDCEDIDCADSPACVPEMACDDGEDNDLDEQVDCDDTDCLDDPACIMCSPDYMEANDGNDDEATAFRFTGRRDFSLHDLGDQDWLRWYVPAQRTVEVDLLFSHAQGDIDLLVTPEGANTRRASSITDNEQIDVLNGSNEGRFFVGRIYRVARDSCQPYTISIDVPDVLESGDGDDEYDTASTEAERGEHYEPNSQRINGLTAVHNDEDLMAIEVCSGGRLQVELFFENVRGWGEGGNGSVTDIDLLITQPGVSLATSLSVTDNELAEWVNDTGAAQVVYARIVMVSNGGIGVYDYRQNINEDGCD